MVTTTAPNLALFEKQKAWALGWIINLIAGELVPPSDDEPGISPNPAQELEDLLAQRIDFYLGQDSKLTQFIGGWKRVWGPFVYLARPPFNKYATNAIYVAQQGNKYVVGVAGTNPKSLQNWLIEDLYVSVLADWAEYADIKPDFPAKISMGTKIGLDNLLRPHPGSSTTIVDFFKNLLAETQAGEKIEILVTGASLGGALSPVLALALHEKKSTWDPKNQATLKVVTFAGPTPGNYYFAERYRLKLGNNTTRVWNSLDIVPHAWKPELLSQIPSLYEAQIPSNPLIEKFVKIGQLLSVGRYYTHVERLTPALEGTLRPIEQTPETSSKQVELDVQLSALKSALATENVSVSDIDIKGLLQFLAQAKQQHIDAYFDLLEFPSEVTKFIINSEQLPPDLRFQEADQEAIESVVSKLLEYSANPDVDE
ncbi:lipase family protein [Nostoc sp.]|uniref:lipase family protein n=1 Tax=Nostoc sp. TaxID=1180 RepID=UPI002FF19A7A